MVNVAQLVIPAAKTRFLHVANGTSTTTTIEAAGIPGARSIWADPLYEGPVPAGLSDTELLDVRMRYLSGPTDRKRAAWAGSDPSQDPANDLREWRAAIERHESYDELILWFEHDLFDQLNLIQLLTWIRDHLPAIKPVSLICIGSFPGRPDFRGLGELRPDELASLLETRQPVSSPQYEVARRAWRALREPTPEVLDELRQDDTSALPHLAAAITRFLQEYPWTTDGLSRSERRLLERRTAPGSDCGRRSGGWTKASGCTTSQTARLRPWLRSCPAVHLRSSRLISRALQRAMTSGASSRSPRQADRYWPAR
jgi:hypothetical protein